MSKVGVGGARNSSGRRRPARRRRRRPAPSTAAARPPGGPLAVTAEVGMESPGTLANPPNGRFSAPATIAPRSSVRARAGRTAAVMPDGGETAVTASAAGRGCRGGTRRKDDAGTGGEGTERTVDGAGHRVGDPADGVVAEQVAHDRERRDGVAEDRVDGAATGVLTARDRRAVGDLADDAADHRERRAATAAAPPRARRSRRRRPVRSLTTPPRSAVRRAVVGVGGGGCQEHEETGCHRHADADEGAAPMVASDGDDVDSDAACRLHVPLLTIVNGWGIRIPPDAPHDTPTKTRSPGETCETIVNDISLTHRDTSR